MEATKESNQPNSGKVNVTCNPTGAVDECTKSLNELLQEREALSQKSVNLQKQILTLQTVPTPPATALSASSYSLLSDRKPTSISQTEKIDAEYKAALHNIKRAQQALAHHEKECGAAAGNLRSRLIAKQKKAEEISSAFQAFKAETSENALDSRTGKHIPKEKLNAIDDEEKAKNEAIRKERLLCLSRKTELRNLESRLKSKETLADGLNLSDFEQLQIENRNLAKKIKGREDELEALSASRRSSIITMAHAKQKMTMIAQMRKKMQTNLESIDQDISISRKTLTSMTKERDSLHKKNGRKAQEAATANKDIVIEDYRKSKKELQQMEDQLSELKTQYHKLTM